jgi:DNA polymerase III epsilon subunit-like protein
VEPELARRIDGRYIVGHNVGVDWRLLHRRYPAITPAGLIDTLRLARHLKLGTKNSLTALTAQLDLTAQIQHLAVGSQPHRALWDTTATALLLAALVAKGWPAAPTIHDLLAIAALDLSPHSAAGAEQTPAQGSLFDAAT